MASILSKRLGKRSLLGARVCTTPMLSADCMTVESAGDLAVSAQLGAYEGGCYKECLEEVMFPTNLSTNRFKLYPGQKVYITHNGKEWVGLVEQHNHVDDEVKIFVLELGLHLCRKTEDVRLVETPRATSMPMEQTLSTSPAGPASVAQRSVSCSIDVPKRAAAPHYGGAMEPPLESILVNMGSTFSSSYLYARMNELLNMRRNCLMPCPLIKTAQNLAEAGQEMLARDLSEVEWLEQRRSDAVEMDEMMAAMVLTSLSCSPIVQSPPCSDLIPTPRVTCDLWKESGDVSDSGSSTTSGHWSAECGASTPSPPHTEASPKYTNEAFSASHVDEGFETDPDPFLLDEPAPRKRKNSVKIMYKCLWPNCGKLLRSIVGIKRHVKTQHLGDGADSDQRKREEDFYYTEVQLKEEAEAESTPKSPSTATTPLLIQPVTPKPDTLALEVPGLESPLPTALSQSAPGSFWHIQADHAYQALPSIQIPVSPHIFTSISWAAAPSALPTLSPIRSRSLSFSEQQQQTQSIKSHLIVASPPRATNGSRKVRGEAKKCRKVYGIEHRDQWCTACRWKKACQRFLD
ncbi:zinc finger protein 395 isoform X1 [Rana temporaria]|uniref:zinc finger protein 395 isoform X1 n=1 Tax=Rana temporaria TaxID=8407 RepID=UPI001AACC5B6|nr:zinc finger protein 395 isoform X1 [Rana temporaria]